MAPCILPSGELGVFCARGKRNVDVINPVDGQVLQDITTVVKTESSTASYHNR